MKKVKVLWFSRHAMTTEQAAALEAAICNKFDVLLEDIEVAQLNGTAANVHVEFMATNSPEGTPDAIYEKQPPLKQIVKGFDVVAAVLPTNLQEQILPFMGETPLLMATNNRQQKADGTAEFVFEKWVRVIAVKIETADF